MKQYKIKESTLKKKKLYYLIFAPFGSMAFSFLFNFYGPNNNSHFSHSVPYAIGFGIFLTIVLIFSSRLSISLFEKNYLFTIDDDYIAVKDKLGVETKIPKNEITEIYTGRNNSISIKGIPVNQIVTIPTDIEDYDEIYTQLNAIKPIALNTDEPFSLKYAIPISIVRLILFFTALFAPNKQLAYSGLGILAILTIWNVIEMNKSKKVDDTTKLFNYVSIAGIVYLLIIMQGK